MNQLFEWLSMGGYYAYVWPAYGLVGITFMGVFLGIKMQKKRTQQQLQQWFKG